jgi:hypothetical protein
MLESMMDITFHETVKSCVAAPDWALQFEVLIHCFQDVQIVQEHRHFVCGSKKIAMIGLHMG